jgi:hypothetical protein
VTDEELAAVWRAWWLSIEGPAVATTGNSGLALSSLVAHLEEHGFAIVRRMDPDLPG